MEEPVLEGHLEDRVGPHGRDPPPLGRGHEEGPDVPDPGTIDELHGQHLRGRELPVDGRYGHRGAGEVGGEAPGVLGLRRVVQLAPDDDLELGHEPPASTSTFWANLRSTKSANSRMSSRSAAT